MENAIQKSMDINFTGGGDFGVMSLRNLRDGGRYTIKLTPPVTGVAIMYFNPSIKKKDGSSFSYFTVVNEILDFVYINNTLYCVNK